MKCIICGSEFEAKRSDAKFCSPSCRVKASRNVVIEPKEVVDNSASDKAMDKPKYAGVTFPPLTDKNIGSDGYLNDKDAHALFLQLTTDQRTRVLYLMQCCHVEKGEAMAQVIENDELI